MTRRASQGGAGRSGARGIGARRWGAARWGAACLAAVVVAGCASTPPEEDPVQIKLTDLDTRLTRIERVLANQSLLDLANQNESLRSDMRALHNDVDELNHSLDASRKQQHDLYADLDTRMRALEARGGNALSGSGVAAATLAGTAGVQPGGAAVSQSADADKVSYQAAFELLKAGQYDRAVAAFQSFLVTYPASALADNAQYWLGEAYYVNKSYPEALAAFERVVQKYPDSRKLPDALLKIGYCDYELKQFAAARDALNQVTSRYADAPASHLAQQRLDRMAAEKD